jgi:hypothetical protein
VEKEIVSSLLKNALFSSELGPAYFLALLLDPFDHCFSSSAERFWSSTAFLDAAASAFFVLSVFIHLP